MNRIESEFYHSLLDYYNKLIYYLAVNEALVKLGQSSLSGCEALIVGAVFYMAHYLLNE